MMKFGPSSRVVNLSFAFAILVMFVIFAFESLYGRPADELRQNPLLWLETIHPDDRAIAQTSGTDLPERGQTTAEYRILRPDGTIRWVLDRKSMLYDESGNPLRIAGIITDITERKRAEEQLRQSEERFSSAFRSSPTPITITRIQDGKFLDANETACRMFGYLREELIGRTSLELGIIDDEARQKNINALKEHGVVRNIESHIITRSGEKRDILLSIEALKMDGENYALAILIDITDRKKAEQALRINEAALKEAQRIAKVGSWEWDTQTNEVRWSDELYSILGIDKEACTGMLLDIFPLIHPDDRERVQRITEQASVEKQAIPIEYRIITPDGTLKHVVGQGITLSAEADNNGRLFGIIQDITERKRTEDDRLARELAERASQAKTEFLSSMSHEFRTPLNAILGFAQLLKIDDLQPNQERGVDQIYKSGRHLLDLVNEVLDIARIESGRMTVSPEPVRVADAVKEVFDLIRPMAEARRLSLTLKIPSSTDVFVEADRQRFKQVLLNLLSNAVKYNREGGAIDVIASLTIDGHLRLQVRDSGVGIPPEKMERIFVPFDRLDTDASEGAGLGLALSKGLMETMGGRIGAESKIGEGTTFWLELKLVTDRLKEVIMAEVEENLTEKMRKGRGLVLYVEDNLANVHLVEAIMDRIPEVKLITAMQGRLATSLAKDHRPDLILLDLHLPDIHGSDVLRWLKAEPATQTIPVVVISADAMPAHVNELLALGAKGYLTKPIDVKEFLEVIEDAVGKPEPAK